MLRFNVPFVLASASPRRRHLLEQLGIEFQVLVPGGSLSRMSESIDGDMTTLLGEQRLRSGFFSGASISASAGV